MTGENPQATADLIGLIAEIAAAYVGNNTVPIMRTVATLFGRLHRLWVRDSIGQFR